MTETKKTIPKYFLIPAILFGILIPLLFTYQFGPDRYIVHYWFAEADGTSGTTNSIISIKGTPDWENVRNVLLNDTQYSSITLANVIKTKR